MTLQKMPELLTFFSTAVSEGDPERDTETVRAYIERSTGDKVARILTQIKTLLDAPTVSVEELGAEANRWFEESEEARAWLKKIFDAFKASSEESNIVKDSNGTPLNEGDSVQVIKDLKVKGGASDLKRGMLIKKIHLIGDPDNIECRVNGSTLVLKTIFLKKS